MLVSPCFSALNPLGKFFPAICWRWMQDLINRTVRQCRNNQLTHKLIQQPHGFQRAAPDCYDI